MRKFRELNIWLKGMEIAKRVYTIVPKLPDYEKYGLVTQLARAVVSISSNIAEGSAKTSNRDFKRFLEMALGSSYELGTDLILVQEIHGVNTEEIIDLAHEEQRMLSAFIKKL